MTLIWRLIRALCGGRGEEQPWLAVIDYLAAENRVLREQLSAAGRRICLSDEQRRDLAVLGRALRPALRSYISIVKPETIMAWYRRLVAARYDSSKGGRRVASLQDRRYNEMIIRI
jgi:putative transposase